MKGRRKAKRVDERQARRIVTLQKNKAVKKRIAEEHRLMKLEEAVQIVEDSKTHNERVFKMQPLSVRMRKKEFLEHLRKSVGVLSAGLEKSGVPRGTYDRWRHQCPWFRDKLDEMADLALDFAETSLFRQIKDGIPGSTIFYLKTKGKKRGYIERTEVVNTIVNKFDGMTDEDLVALLEKQEQAQLNERKTIRIQANND